MIDRYNNLSDTVPHEEYIVCITESSTYKGHKFSSIIKEIKNRVPGDKLTLQEYYPPVEKSNDYDRLIQNSVWILNIDDCISSTDSGTLFKQEYLELQIFLKTRRYPDDAGVFLCVDDVTMTQKSKVKQTFPELTIADTKDMLVGIVLGHIADANPVSTRGQEKILSWNNDVCDTLGVP
jgi:hypothetical protein